MATHSSTLAWKIPWMEEPGRLQSMGSLRVGYNWVTSLSLSCIGEGKGNPLQHSCLENPRDSGAWWAALYGVAQSRTRLKRLSSSSSSTVFIFLLSDLFHLCNCLQVHSCFCKGQKFVLLHDWVVLHHVLNLRNPFICVLFFNFTKLRNFF